MPNIYCNLIQLKHAGTLDIASVTDYDTQLLRIAEDSSRRLDKYTDRFFYIYEGTMYQDGGAIRVVLDFDVQSITSLKIDPDGDGTYDTTFNLASTAPYDAFLYPQNITPKTRLEINPWGDIGHFAPGIRNGIEITGVFGYGADWPSNYYHSATVTVGAAYTSTGSTIDLSGNSTNEIAAGMTLRIGSQQLFVRGALSGSVNSTCPVTQGVNGTSAASATTGTAISIYDYPQAITEACLIQTMRTWKRRESAYTTKTGNLVTGEYEIYAGLDTDVKEVVRQYRRGQRQPRFIN